MIGGAFAVLRSNIVFSSDFAAIDTCRRTSWSQPDIAPQYSLFGRLFSVFFGLGQVRPQLFLSTILRLFATVCWVTSGVPKVSSPPYSKK